MTELFCAACFLSQNSARHKMWPWDCGRCAFDQCTSDKEALRVSCFQAPCLYLKDLCIRHLVPQLLSWQLEGREHCILDTDGTAGLVRLMVFGCYWFLQKRSILVWNLTFAFYTSYMVYCLSHFMDDLFYCWFCNCLRYLWFASSLDWLLKPVSKHNNVVGL